MKICFVTTADVFDKRGNGGVKASYDHLLLLQKRYGAENVNVVYFTNQDDAAETDKIKPVKRLKGNINLLLASFAGCRLYWPWGEKKIVEYLDAKTPDIVFFDFSIEGKLIKRISKRYKTIVFFHNIEADYTWNKVRNEGAFFFPAYIAAKMNDKWATEADRVLCFNERDSIRLNELYGRKADACIPITLQDEFDETKINATKKREILFLGSLFGPNQDGIEWFINNVMIKLKDISLTIVGLGFETKKEDYERYDNVHVIGTVDTPAEFYYKFSAVVMPIRYGAGMKVKTAEAMMYGRYIFASDEALEGYEVDGVQGIFRCNTVDEYIRDITQFFEENIGRESYSKEVRELYVAKYSTESAVGKIGELIEKLI